MKTTTSPCDSCGAPVPDNGGPVTETPEGQVLRKPGAVQAYCGACIRKAVANAVESARAKARGLLH